MHQTEPDQPLDAPLIDRVAQPAFDRLFARAEVSVTQVAVEAWLALIVCSFGEAALHALADPAGSLKPLLYAAVYSAFFLFLLRAARARHRAWCDDPFAHAGRLPTAYLSFATIRFSVLLLTGVSLPLDAAEFLRWDNPLEQILGMLVDLLVLIALYADACRAPPVGTEPDLRSSAAPANT